MTPDELKTMHDGFKRAYAELGGTLYGMGLIQEFAALAHNVKVANKAEFIALINLHLVGSGVTMVEDKQKRH
jgi:hypothetical protein